MLDYALERTDLIQPKNLFLYGQELGALLAIYMANERGAEVRGVILENAMKSTSSVI